MSNDRNPADRNPARLDPAGRDAADRDAGDRDPGGLGRRRFLFGTAAGGAGTALTAEVLAGGARADARAAAGTPQTAGSYPFHGRHQAGILMPGPARKQKFACFAAFDVTAASGKDLAALLQTLTGRARFLTTGCTPA